MESLEKHVVSMADILEREYELYQSVYDLIKKEQRILVSADIEDLEDNLNRQKILTEKINKLESKRVEELEVIGIYLGTLPEDLKLAAIAQHVEPELSARLLRHEKLFKSVLQEILKLNKSNKFLITRSLQFIEKNIQVFFGAIEEKGLYDNVTKKKSTSSTRTRMVDWKA
ncbi:flagellar protein FlgN [candidate division KSB1 bacterium]